MVDEQPKEPAPGDPVFPKLRHANAMTAEERARSQDAAAPAPRTEAPKPAPARPAAAAKAAPKGPFDPATTARRRFVFWTLFGSLGLITIGSLRFFFPRVLFEPKTRFKIGPISDYPYVASAPVFTKWQKEHRIWVVRDPDRIHVILAVCTHLGCTPDWKESENKFKCPCHGSGFDRYGVNFEGPAPRPMEHCHVTKDPIDGQIVVDKAKVYRAERGEWDRAGASLRI